MASFVLVWRYMRRLFCFFILLLVLSVATLSVRGAEGAQVTLAWDQTSDAAAIGYRLYWGTESRQYALLADVGNATSEVVSNLQDGVTYYFAVTAYDTRGNDSAYSNEVSYQAPGGFNRSPYFDTVQKLYIGYYQRPADPEGLLFWSRALQSVDTNGDGGFDGENFMWVLEQFAFSPESQVVYSGGISVTNIATVIDSIYMHLFNRHAEPDGLAFWVNTFNAGASSPASILWEVMKGSQGTDKDTLNNKVTASTRFAQVLDPELDGVAQTAYPSWAGSWLSDVTYDPATIPTEDQIRLLF